MLCSKAKHTMSRPYVLLTHYSSLHTEDPHASLHDSLHATSNCFLLQTLPVPKSRTQYFHSWRSRFFSDSPASKIGFTAIIRNSNPKQFSLPLVTSKLSQCHQYSAIVSINSLPTAYLCLPRNFPCTLAAPSATMAKSWL